MNDDLEKIQNEEVTRLPLTQFEGDIVLVEDGKKFKEIIPELAMVDVFGFDTETRPSFKKGKKNKVSLLQLATTEKVYLIRLNKTGIPKALKMILSDPSRKKIGVAVHDDIRQLQLHNHFEPNGFIDLQGIIKKNGIGETGLRKMSAIVLKKKISKSAQLSNWEQDKLSNKQKKYAATDAWICLEIYNRLSQK